MQKWILRALYRKPLLSALDSQKILLKNKDHEYEMKKISK